MTDSYEGQGSLQPQEVPVHSGVDYDRYAHGKADGQPQQNQQPAPLPYAVPAASPQHQQPLAQVRAAGLTAAQKFWYVLMCIGFGAGYFAKIPAKKALTDFGLGELTAAESFWYVLMCIAFGAGYFAKIPTAKALSELDQFRNADYTRLQAR
jgi:hypothetical protein